MSAKKNITPAEAFATMAQEVNPVKAKDINAVFQFELAGPKGGTWTAQIQNGACTVENKAAEKPNVTIRMSDDDFVSLVSGKLQAVPAFISGRIKVYGDYNLAAKLPVLFED